MSALSGLRKFMAVAKPAVLCHAILNTQDQFRQSKPLGLKAGSDAWLYHSHFRSLLTSQVRVNWAQLSGLDSYQCPFTDDAIVHQWCVMRKDVTTHEEIDGIELDGIVGDLPDEDPE